MFFKISFLKNFTIFTWKNQCSSLFLVKLQARRPASLLRRYFDRGVFLWILQKFEEYLFYFYRTPQVAAAVASRLGVLQIGLPTSNNYLVTQWLWFNTWIMLRNFPPPLTSFSIIKLKTEVLKNAYLEPSQTFKIELFLQKENVRLKATNYFSKKLHHVKNLWTTVSKSVNP